MAFVTPNTATTSTPSQAPAQGSNKDKKTTIAYVNLYIPLADGSRVKLVSDLTLRMYAEKAVEAGVIDAIKSGVKTIEDLQNLIQVEVSLARDESSPIDVAW